MPALPAIVRQQCRASDEILQRRGIGRRGLGALARDQVELGKLLAFILGGDQGRPAIELIADLEDRLLTPLWRRLRGEQPPYSEADEPDVADVVDEHARRFDILVDQAMPMDLADGCRQ